MPPRWPRGRTSRRVARSGGGPLEDDLPDEQHERARDVEAVGEERAVAGVRPLLGLHAADGEDHVVGLAGEQVAAARAAVDEQADAGGVAALDLRAVGRRRAGHQRAGLLLDPAERGDVVVRAEQDPGLAGAGLRREVGLPLGQAVRAVREPARHLRRVAVAHRAPQHRQREPVDLEEDDPGNVGLESRPPWRRAIRWTTRSVYVSSSFVPKITSSTTLTAATTSAASSAQPKESTTKVLSSTRDASTSTRASSNRTSTKPSASMNGRRSAARTGGSTAFSTAITAATTNAPAVPAMSTPGRIAAATPIDAAVSAHDSSTRSGLNRGRAGSHETASPYVVLTRSNDSASGLELASPRADD